MNNDIETRIQNIESELKSIKTIIDVSKQSTDAIINKYLFNKYYIKDFKDTLWLFQYRGNNYELFLKAYDPKIFTSNENIIKSYISTTYNIPNPTIVTLTINNQTYYDYIH